VTERADLLIAPRWLIPIEPAGAVLEDHAVAVRAGQIVAVGPRAELNRSHEPREVLVLGEHALIPGMVNAHTHAAMALLRGYADDMPLMQWLSERIWPAEAKHVCADFVRDGTLLACAEMLRGGVTCFNDMYFHPEAAAEAALQVGMRAALGIIVIEFPTGYAADPDDYLAKSLAARDSLRHEPLISFCMAPHAPYTVSDRSFERVLTLAEQLDLPIHIHIHETRSEIEESLVRYGCRPLQRLTGLGIVGPRLIAVHGVYLEPDEIASLATHGATIAHCPTSNMKLASGAAPIAPALAAGVRIALGTDGCASNNRLDLFWEMRHAALLAKVVTGDPTALGPHDLLRMATLGGAQALGLERRIGSIQAGKRADLCAVRLVEADYAPCYDPAAHLVHVAGREAVSHVWVDGIARVREHALLQVRNKDLLAVAQLWQNRLIA
jgi:5-methylthioadenosine/S-adenosylhomocysteine deaminase